jgi:hypothetical protein
VISQKQKVIGSKLKKREFNNKKEKLKRLKGYKNKERRNKLKKYDMNRYK